MYSAVIRSRHKLQAPARRMSFVDHHAAGPLSLRQVKGYMASRMAFSYNSHMPPPLLLVKTG